MESEKFNRETFVRRSKLYVPANREKFLAKAWTRGADCIILDLEDAVAPADKASARRMVKDDIPIVRKGGAEIQVRINREFEEEDLDAIVIPGVTSIMVPKCESVEDVRRVDRMVTELEKERGLPVGRIQFDLIFETARGSSAWRISPKRAPGSSPLPPGRRTSPSIWGSPGIRR